VKRVICTICSLNYLSKAKVFLASSQLHNPKDDHVLVIVDRKQNIHIDAVQIIWAEELEIENFLQKAFCFDVIELNTNVKPTVLLYLLERYDMALYFDPDVYLCDSIDLIASELSDDAVLLTPHYTSPIQDNRKPNDWELLKFGVFNLGFIAVNRHHATTKPLLEWWSERCLALGFYEPQSGLAVDQKWLSLAPGFFTGIRVSRNLGLNVAYWNLHERNISFHENRWWVNQTIPLIFVHFSSFDVDNPSVIAKKQSRIPDNSRPDFLAIATVYRHAILEQSSLESEKAAYGYSTFEDQRIISPTLRRLYAAMLSEQPTIFSETNPFIIDSRIYHFTVKHNLFSQSEVKNKNFRDLDKETKIIHWALYGLKILLRLLGPNRYFELMRFLAHISSIRVQGSVYLEKEP
jgi:hypothetical protein